ncbi:zinc finger BED domain-containing protein RICESLEEPER 1 [Hevea brasiliensis]|uniref:zinc finger BED domain-containing protein RICESLEEPER 1 n=1 Tax=Hevea brasiliensis TaxID=3981 RepID=UPI002601422A|nr:zinc finger BED domain-containing protein RICESLEEPER 1 [Hevea brasiliensis]
MAIAPSSYCLLTCELEAEITGAHSFSSSMDSNSQQTRIVGANTFPSSMDFNSQQTESSLGFSVYWMVPIRGLDNFSDIYSRIAGSNSLAKPCEQAGTSWSDSNPNVWRNTTPNGNSLFRPVPRQGGQQTDESLFGVAGPCAQTGTSSSGPIPSSLGSSGGSAWRSVPTSQGGQQTNRSLYEGAKQQDNITTSSTQIPSPQHITGSYPLAKPCEQAGTSSSGPATLSLEGSVSRSGSTSQGGQQTNGSLYGGYFQTSTVNSVEAVESCKDATVSQPSETTQRSSNSGFDKSTTPINPSQFVAENIEPTSSLPPTSQLGKKRKLTSSVWDHFGRVNCNGNDWAICHHCKSRLKANSKNGTKSLHNHLEKCGKKNNQDIAKCLEKQKQISLQFGNFTFDQEKSRRELACAIILHEYPLSIVEHVGFKKFVASLQPLFEMVSRNTIEKDILNIYAIEFEKLYNVFKKLECRIAITTDMWTSNQKEGFMSITAHYIDESWVLQNRILRFVHVLALHTKEELEGHLMDAFSKWDILTKISTITVDNYTNDGVVPIIDDKLYSDLLCDGPILCTRYYVHIVNLAIKDGLSIIENSLVRIRVTVAFWSDTPQRVKTFEEMAKELKISCEKKLSLDCRTHWKSTYLMLETAIGYKDVFPRLRIREKNYTSVPTDDDWEMAKMVLEKLETIRSISKISVGRKYPTSNCYFVPICHLRSSMVDWMKSDNEVIKTMSSKMFDYLQKYWKVVRDVLSIAVILDPRYKMRVFEYFFPMIYGDDASSEIEQAKTTCYNLLSNYQCRVSEPKSHFISLVPPIPMLESQGSLKKDWSNLVAFLSSSSSSVHVKSELNYYLEESLFPCMQDFEFDILNWWKTNGIKYPTLQKIARDFLAMLVFTNVSKSAFSIGGRVLSVHQSRLCQDTL